MSKTVSNILEIRDLTVQVGKETLLNHLNLIIREGEVHALLGQNGSGKTSLMMTIMGYSAYHVTGGQILFRGQDLAGLDVGERARLGIAIAQQRPPTIRGVTLRGMAMFALRDTPEPEKKLAELARDTQMEAFLDRSINDGLSGGEIKRAELLQLLAQAPSFAMMDEPDSGVDIEALELVGRLTNRLFAPKGGQKNAGLLITHSGSVLKYLHIDKAHILYDGHIGCSGDSDKMLDQIAKYGYGECVRCMETRQAE
jgi:Fe-S cluster assembly ATP-binding protein